MHFTYHCREVSSARPGGRYRPSSVTTGRAVEGPLISRTESREHFSRRAEAGDGKIKATGSLSPASTVRWDARA